MGEFMAQLLAFIIFGIMCSAILAYLYKHRRPIRRWITEEQFGGYYEPDGVTRAERRIIKEQWRLENAKTRNITKAEWRLEDAKASLIYETAKKTDAAED